MKFITKLWDNLGWRAIATIGVRGTLRAWSLFVFKLPEVLRSRNLVPIDKGMSRVKNLRIHHHLGRFVVHPKAIDQLIQEGCYCFGSVRELYIRDCYFRHHRVNPKEIKVVVDLGANRGMFSSLCTSFAERIVAVEPQYQYGPVIEYNMRQNNFKNYSVVSAFIGTHTDTARRIISFQDLMKETHLTKIDFLKMDIEGGEFELFEHLPLEHITSMTLEVHPESGNPQNILHKLVAANFDVIATDSAFNLTNERNRIDYIYAHKTN